MSELQWWPALTTLVAIFFGTLGVLGMLACFGRQAQATLRAAFFRLVSGLAPVIRAATSGVGAAGGGWAVLATVRAATEVAGGPGSAKGSEGDATAASDAQKDSIDGPVPKHIAVIMDGNRRFGRREHGDSLSGHKAGGEKLRDFMKWCCEEGVQYLTVFAFSTENWKRDENEVEGMMDLFLTEVPQLGRDTARLNVSVKFLIADGSRLPEKVKKAFADLEEESSVCTGMRLNVCLSYGGRSDVVGACQRIAKEVAAGELAAEDVDEAAVSQRLLTGGCPDPDVLIRTSGERRLSNFLMYQLAYAEFFFLEQHWPEVTREDLMEIIGKYKARHRRFGK